MPTRMCLACRQRAPQEQLIRIRRRNDSWAINAPAPGRSAYWCGDPACLEKLLVGSRLGHALKVKFSSEDVAALRPELSTYKR